MNEVVGGVNVRNYSLLIVFTLFALLVSGCSAGDLCGNNVCDADKGETIGVCPVDCEAEQISSPTPLKIGFSPETIISEPGDAFTVDVIVSGVPDLFGFQFDVSYNPAILEFKEAKKGGLLSNDSSDRLFCMDYQPTPGLIKKFVCTMLGENGIKGNGVLETLTFKALTKGSSTLSLSNVKIADSKVNEMKIEVGVGQVSIK
jgi:hypothetical protein